MHTPHDTLESAKARAAEITWWNRAMTKLNEVDGVSNATSFVADDLIEQKGPFVEFVDAPQFHDQSAAEFLADLDYDEAITNAIVEELFAGDTKGSLYQHQAETIEAIETTNRDSILAVPTASGKTEAFFLPILNDCLSTDEEGLKSIVVYPMKTLGVDQLNRFLTYLDQINRYRDPEDRITIGIWDSDTPTRVGTRDYEVEAGSYVRGLVDPRDDSEKLRIFDETSVGTDDITYSWVRVTRDGIRRGVDILLTVPEALDYMFVSNNPETREILGTEPNDQPVKHIVFDEAHVWSGIQGSAVSLLSRRLKAFYADRDPQVTMVSATVEDPRSLASDLTGTPKGEINDISFTAREFPVQDTPNFGRFEPATLEEIIHTLALTQVDGPAETQITQFELEGALATLRSIRLIATDDLQLGPRAEEWMIEPIVDALDKLLLEHEEKDELEILASVEGRNAVVEAVIEDSGFFSGWYEFVISAVPEVPAFTSWFDSGTTGEVEFKAYDDLIAEATELGLEDPEGILETVMAFGQLAGIITEKYHVFLKPPHKVYWCQECDLVTRDSKCPECNSALPEMQFCRRCHEPYIEWDDDGDETVFAPISADGPADECPGCEGWIKTTDVGVPTSSLLSYMLTEICRVTPSKKTLVFSDSRSAAESVGDQIIETEYGLMAETLYVQELIEAGGEMDNYELFRTVSDRLREEYWQPLIQNEIDEDGTAYNFLRTLLDDIEAHAMLSRCENLIESAIITAEPVTSFEDPEALVVAHELYTMFVLGKSNAFRYNKVAFDGLTREKMTDRLDSRMKISRKQIDEVLDDILEAFLAEGIISLQSWEEVQNAVQMAGIDEPARDEVHAYLEDARETVNEASLQDEPADSGVFIRTTRRDESTIVLLPSAAFCSSCYSSYPIPDKGDGIHECQNCGDTLETYDRFTREGDTLRADPGYARVDSGWPYAIDHWAHDVTRPLHDGKEPEFITVGIHKGDIPHTLRGAIEEGFRKDDPDVNVVSATPTMELGVDIGTLDTVAQVGIPPTLTNYVQRSGRTGRTRGSSSLVMTVARGTHPVDGHYYGNLEQYLADFEPIRVPDPYEFDELLAGHVVTEVFAYLARNPHESNVFERVFTLSEPQRENLSSYVSAVEKHLSILRNFISEEMDDPLHEHVESVFGYRGVEVYEEVFFEEGPLSLSTRTEQTFSRLTSMSSGADANKNLTETNSRLDQWLSRLGYLANYRNFGQTFPVKFSGRRDHISFESSGRLYDMYPGEENDLGAVLTLHGTDYIVDDVRATSSPVVELAVCTNEDCDRPFESYETDQEFCPHCDESLEITDIHGVSSVECKSAVGGQRGYSTRGLMTTHVRRATEDFHESEEITLFDLPATVSYGQFELTNFVYAFERRHSSSPKKKVLRSEALVERDENESSSTGDSWLDQLDDVEKETYRPVGQQYHTQGLHFRVDLASVQDRYDGVVHDGKSWPQALVSLEQSLEKAVAIVANCDRSDFNVKTSTTDETLDIFIVDGRQGGNGITWQVFEEVDRLEEHVIDIASCKRCHSYCDECLLLSRTPAYYLENDLLDRRTLAGIVGNEGGD
ncbi:DEAD/DEAH box helicase [Natronorubrum texcoconense]|uniref:DEAD/DEAH box helicase n=2 Tax=Natronorubrum texcoconense TaxID=1095776 RepID=A0A1G8UZ63_9EURY|nr:DEAD/DEAH box helicase [Natronorubrum texcoconense]